MNKATLGEWDPARVENLPMFEVFGQVWDSFAGAQRWPTVEELTRVLTQRGGLDSGGGAPIRFVEQGLREKRFESVYDVRIFETGEVPTRMNWHDFFNALTWMIFPKSKVRVNACHYEVLNDYRAQWGEERRRSELEHLMCLINESAVLLPCSDPGIEELIRTFAWKRLFLERRSDLREKLGVFVFGHAIYEKLLTPYVGLTGHGIIIPVLDAFFDKPVAEQLVELDQRLLAILGEGGPLKSTRDLCPFPLLGYPGFYPGNEESEFYDDVSYFRPGRRRGKGQ